MSNPQNPSSPAKNDSADKNNASQAPNKDGNNLNADKSAEQKAAADKASSNTPANQPGAPLADKQTGTK